MAKYLVQASYTSEGIKGVLKEGGTGRRNAVEKLVESVGGKLEAYYFALGADDLYAIVDYPDLVAAATVSMTVAATGAAQVRTVALLTPEEIDRAAKTRVAYRSPGASKDVFRQI